MTTEHKAQKDGGSFMAVIDGHKAGEITYEINEGHLTIKETNVDEEFSGQGIGRKLVLETVEFAREKNMKIVPVCSFAKSVFDKQEELRDMLAF